MMTESESIDSNNNGFYLNINNLRTGNMWHINPKPDPSQPKTYSKVNLTPVVIRETLI